MTGFSDRILRAARLDPRLYEEVKGDPDSFKQAVMLIFLSSLAGGIGLLWPGLHHAWPQKFFGGLAAGFLGWFVWVFAVYLIGVKFLGGPLTYSNLGELLRVTGFASAPGLIRVLGLYQPARMAVWGLALVWMLAAMVLAVRKALEYSSTGQTFLVCLGGWLFLAAVSFAFLWLGNLSGI